jgi:hypothetical protein
MFSRLHRVVEAGIGGPRIVRLLLGLLLLVSAQPLSLYAQQPNVTTLVTADVATPQGGQAVSVAISGQVLGPEGEVLSGATAQLEGTSAIAVTNAEGKFVLTIRFSDVPVHITCRYAGYDDSRLTLSKPPTSPVLVEMGKTVKQKLTVTGQLRDL